MKPIRILFKGKTRIIRDIKRDDGDSLFAFYRGHSIEIGPMYTRGEPDKRRSLVVRAADGCMICDTNLTPEEMPKGRESLLTMALENILYGEK